MAQITAEQGRALDAIESGSNVLLTGPPGVGKSYTIHAIMDSYRNSNRAALTAMTGTAAALLNAATLFSFLGIGIGEGSVEDVASRIPAYRKKKLRRLELLIVDEMSMMSSELFDKISRVLSIIRRDERAWGGVQLVLCGDFHQLGPVKGQFCFLAEEWARCAFVPVVLTHNHRQSGESLFQEMLGELRMGVCSERTAEVLSSLEDTQFPPGIEPTRIYSLRADTDSINAAKLRDLAKRLGVRPTVLKPNLSSEQARGWAKARGVQEALPLLPGAQVMLSYNRDVQRGLVNGARGVVESITTDPTPVIRVKFANGLVEDISFRVLKEEDGAHEARYMPLKLAWAITIHKSQGMTLDAVELDLGDSIFEYGQAYTALSRAKCLASIRVVKWASKSFKTHPAVLEFSAGLTANAAV
jgi:ATP-dependent DNA helicase PIF1